MLSGPLLITRFYKGKATPFSLELNAKTTELSTFLIGLFQTSIGKMRSELEEEIRSYQAGKINQKAVQGLGKILFNRSEFSHSQKEEPTEIRKKVFSAAADYWKNILTTNTLYHDHKTEVLRKLGIEDSEIHQETEAWLFGDVRGNQRLISFDPMEPDQLIHRFNIEQVQGLLLNAINLELRVKKTKNTTFRQVVRMMKFFRLMFDLKESDGEWIELVIDGPGSILDNSRSYGKELAQLFPAILLLSAPWCLTANLSIPRRPKRFLLELTENNSFQTHYTKTGVWKEERLSELIQRFNQRYEQEYRADSVQDILKLKNNNYLLPDITIRRISPGKKSEETSEYHIEWIQYLTQQKIEWINTIAPEIPDNYILAIKGKRSRLNSLIEKLGCNLIVFTKELTAPALKKAIEPLRSC